MQDETQEVISTSENISGIPEEPQTPDDVIINLSSDEVIAEDTVEDILSEEDGDQVSIVEKNGQE